MEHVVRGEPATGPAEVRPAGSDGEGHSSVHDRTQPVQQHGPGGLLPRHGLSEVRTSDQTGPN